jgi:hypothetical protein
MGVDAIIGGYGECGSGMGVDAIIGGYGECGSGMGVVAIIGEYCERGSAILTCATEMAGKLPPREWESARVSFRFRLF